MLLMVEQHTRIQALSGSLLILLFSEESDPVKIPIQDQHNISFFLSAGFLSLCSLGGHTCLACACSGTFFDGNKMKISPHIILSILR
jgi:hypothetical protein